MPLSNELWNAPASGGTATPTQLGVMFAGWAGGTYPTGGYSGLSNKINSSGVVASDTAAVATANNSLAGAGYGGDKAIFAFGGDSTGNLNHSNLVSNSGVIATDTDGVGTARGSIGGANFGLDKAIFGFGNSGSATAITNLVSNEGVVASDTSGVGSVRLTLAAAGYAN